MQRVVAGDGAAGNPQKPFSWGDMFCNARQSAAFTLAVHRLDRVDE
jgi:hypothetical protein